MPIKNLLLRISFFFLGIVFSINSYAQYEALIGAAFAYKEQQEHQRNVTIVIIAAFILGIAILIAIINNKKVDKREASEENESQSNVLKDFNETRNLNSDSYKIFLVKKYSIEKNDALEKIICDNKLFDNIELALIHADNCEAQLNPKLISAIEQKKIVLDCEPKDSTPTHSEPIKVVTIQDSSENFIEKNMKPIMVFGTFFWILVAIFVFVH